MARWKTAPLGAALVGLGLVLTACTGAAEGAPSDGEGGEQLPGPGEAEISGTVTFWHSYSSGSLEATTLEEELIPEFEADHPGVDVKSVTLTWDDLRQKLVTAVAGDALPDLVRTDIMWVPELAALGVLVPLSEAMPDFQEYADQMYPGPLETNLFQGEYYGLPLDTNTRVLMYNADTLAQAGLDGPPETFEEMRDAAEALDEIGVDVFADNSTAGWNVLPWIWSAGGDVTDPDVTTASGYIDSAESIEGVQLLVDLYQEGAIPDTILGVEGATAPSDALVGGQIGTMLDGPWMYPIFEASYPDFEVQAAPVPAGDGGSISVVGGESVVLTRSSENKEAATEFMRFLLEEETQLRFAEVGQMSVLSSVGDQLTDIQEYYAPFVEQLATAKPRTPSPAWPQMEEVLKREVQLAMRGEKSVEDAMKTCATEMDALLARYAA